MEGAKALVFELRGENCHTLSKIVKKINKTLLCDWLTRLVFTVYIIRQRPLIS